MMLPAHHSRLLLAALVTVLAILPVAAPGRVPP